MQAPDPQEAEKQEYDRFLKALGARIRALRKERGWTLRHMVVQHDFHLSAWQGFEAGRFGMSLPSLLRVARALGLRPSELLAPIEVDVPIPATVAEATGPSRPPRKRIGAAGRALPK